MQIKLNTMRPLKKQQCNDLVLQNETYVLNEWSLAPLKYSAIAVEGYRNDVEAKKLWRSTQIVERISSKLVKSASGQFYYLIGQLKYERSTHRGFSKYLTDLFRCGFPKKWKELLAYWQNIVFSKAVRDISYFSSPNNFYDFEDQPFCKSSKGRQIVPFNPFWCDNYKIEEDAFTEGSHLHNFIPLQESKLHKQKQSPKVHPKKESKRIPKRKNTKNKENKQNVSNTRILPKENNKGKNKLASNKRKSKEMQKKPEVETDWLLNIPDKNCNKRSNSKLINSTNNSISTSLCKNITGKNESSVSSITGSNYKWGSFNWGTNKENETVDLLTSFDNDIIVPNVQRTNNKKKSFMEKSVSVQNKSILYKNKSVTKYFLKTTLETLEEDTSVKETNTERNTKEQKENNGNITRRRSLRLLNKSKENISQNNLSISFSSEKTSAVNVVAKNHCLKKFTNNIALKQRNVKPCSVVLKKTEINEKYFIRNQEMNIQMNCQNLQQTRKCTRTQNKNCEATHSLQIKKPKSTTKCSIKNNLKQKVQKQPTKTKRQCRRSFVEENEILDELHRVEDEMKKKIARPNNKTSVSQSKANAKKTKPVTRKAVSNQLCISNGKNNSKLNPTKNNSLVLDITSDASFNVSVESVKRGKKRKATSWQGSPNSLGDKQKSSNKKSKQEKVSVLKKDNAKRGKTSGKKNTGKKIDDAAVSEKLPCKNNSQKKKTKQSSKKEEKEIISQERPRITARKGTAKRNQQLRELLLYENANHEVDLFDSTPFRKKQFHLSPSLLDSHDTDIDEISTPTGWNVLTPTSHIPALIPVSAKRTPNLSWISPSAFFTEKNLKEVDTYICNRRKKGQKAQVNKRPRVNKTMISTMKHIPSLNEVNSNIFMLPETKSAASDDDEDYYFSDCD